MNRRVDHALIELFAGCGGAGEGLRRAGWRHTACVERDTAAAATLRAAGFPVIEADVRAVDLSAYAGATDLVWASPPCQPGSAAGHRLGALDARDGWPWTFDLLDVLRPTWFLAENVLGWTHHHAVCEGEGGACTGCYWEGFVLPELARRFAFSGAWRLDAADFGVPQRRRRVILWGGPLPLSAEGPPRSHVDPRDAEALLLGRRPWVSLGEAIGDSLLDPATCTVRACYPCDGSHGRACAEASRLGLPAPTVTTSEVKGTRANAQAGWSFHGGPDRASDAAFLVAGVRRIDLAEGLRLQGLPADWPLQGSAAARYTQVGNAVPPALAEAPARLVLGAHRVWQRLQSADPAALAAALRRERLTLPSSLGAPA